jgi:hypothetical protein
MLIEFSQGSESFSDPKAYFSVDIQCFHQDVSTGVWKYVGQGKDLDKGCLRFPVIKCLKALACEYNTLNGQWTNIVLDLPANAMLMVKLSCLKAYDLRGERSAKHLALQPAEGMPLRRLIVKTTGHPKAAQKSIHFEGQFYLLDERLLHERDGIRYPACRLVTEESVTKDDFFEVQDVQGALQRSPVKGILRSRRPGEASVTYTKPTRRPLG